jgi:hypothetical protein
MCKFRARGLLEVGDRIDVFDLAEIEEDKDPGLTFDTGKMLRGITPETAKPEDLMRLDAARDMAMIRVDQLDRKVERGNHMLDFTGAAHRFIGMCVLTLDLINTPGLIGLRQHDPHRGLARRLYAARGGFWT